MSDSSTGNYGDELVTNGEFTISSLGWNLSGGAQYSDGLILFPSDGSSFKTISQPIEIVPNRQYVVKYSLVILSGSVTSSVILGDSGESHGSSSGVLPSILTPSTDGFLRISVETANGGSATVDSVSVRELVLSSDLSSMSESSISGISSSSSSDSSTELKSSSVSTNSSSITTFSSDSSVSSGSSTSFSESSSSSSGQKCYFDFPFKIEAYEESPVWCFERAGEYIYAGTGRNGEILKSNNLNTWSSWQTVPDSHARCMKLYSNGLFIGTEPNGYVYVYNFSTDSFYRYVETSDHSVTTMAVFRGELYVGTSPGGNLFVFNGVFWKKQKEFYGGGITSLFVQNDKLYASIISSETIMEYDGTSWVIVPTTAPNIPDDLQLIPGEQKESNFTVASNRNLSTEPVSESDLKFINRTGLANSSSLNVVDKSEIRPILPESNINSINYFDEGLLFGGSKGVVIKYDGETFKTVHNNNDSPIVCISSNGFFCSENKLFVLSQTGSNL
ncbi:MAG: hypothetical protein M0R32_02700 [Candidatus Cloacimonetes bacterium]|jgi:hypothetical protein|nr:hypothetical protein [Candidatus Cloacimonadota bacterium]